MPLRSHLDRKVHVSVDVREGVLDRPGEHPLCLALPAGPDEQYAPSVEFAKRLVRDGLAAP